MCVGVFASDVFCCLKRVEQKQRESAVCAPDHILLRCRHTTPHTYPEEGQVGLHVLPLAPGCLQIRLELRHLCVEVGSHRSHGRFCCFDSFHACASIVQPRVSSQLVCGTRTKYVDWCPTPFISLFSRYYSVSCTLQPTNMFVIQVSPFMYEWLSDTSPNGTSHQFG